MMMQAIKQYITTNYVNINICSAWSQISLPILEL